MTINFNLVGSFQGVQGEPQILNNPTSIQFGADGRLYVAEQNGTINAFTIELQNGEYVATANEELVSSNGTEVVKSIQNHNDDGSLSDQQNRQVTGLVVTGTATNPVLYVSSSDPRIATFNDPNLDTNSGVVTRVTWNGTEWEAVDIIRGLPRSEENHSVNGMVLSEDGTKLFLTVGGNTNNGAPSDFFAYTGEYALSGTILEIDLVDIESRPILTDPNGGQNGTSRQYIYDLPTLDDPTVSNISNGVGEDISGLDEDGPWGGNDGFNMAILPADAPMRIFADGLRNQYDLALTQNGQLYTVDNGSNAGFGGNPVDANGNPTDQPGAGEATNDPNDGGTGDPEPLFLLEDGGYYGHPAPARANQDLPWTVFNDQGNPDTSLSPNSVPNLADLVPDSVDIAEGFLIDPSKFTDNPARLTESGIRVERDSPDSNAIITVGSSSNGLVEYTDDAFGGALQGSLIVTQFNGNVTLLNLSDDGTSIEPLVDPTAGNEVMDDDGIFPLVTGQSLPLDVTTGVDGTIWVAEFGNNSINVFAPDENDVPPPNGPDDDDGDGINNINDPFILDANNGNSVLVSPSQTLLWDFDANQDNNLPGANGYGGGLTGVMINNTTDFQAFFQEPSTIEGQIIKLDNVKFNTAAGGGTTVIESVSNGDPFETPNNGEYLFHTGVTLAPTVETFTIKWSVFNPGTQFTGSFQQIGGYIGTGDQSNYLKIVAIDGSDDEIQILLEDNDVVQSISFISADGLFDLPTNQQIFFELEIDPVAGTAIPVVSYETGDENITTVTGEAVDLNGTTVLDAIQGNYTVEGQNSGLAVGLFSSNVGEPTANTFQATFNEIEITATGDTSQTILYRVNAGGPEVTAIDGGIAWSADTTSNNSPFLVDAGSNDSASFPAVEPGDTVPVTVPGAIFDTERWDQPGGSQMEWAFDVPESGMYEVRLYVGNGFSGTNDPGERVFNVAIEGEIPPNLDNIDLSSQFGNEVGGVITNMVTVTDGTLNLEFIHSVENPLINGIEIVQLGGGDTDPLPTVSIVNDPANVADENQGQIQISLLSDVTVPSNETVNVTFEIVPGTATALEDYQYLSTSATFDEDTGVYTDTVAIAGGSSDVTFFVDILADALIESEETFTVNITDVSPNAQIGLVDTTTVTIEDNSSTEFGEATLSITADGDSDNVQASNFDSNSFQIANSGDKKIVAVNIDVTNALYPDTVFDPFGLAGDTLGKQLTIDTNGDTGVVIAPEDYYIGAGGTAGFEAIQLEFDENVDGGFEPGETLGFSVDMDPNSIAGAQKAPLDAGSNPSWDIGGVSGAELIGSTFTVTFDDGTTATGQLQGTNDQGGSQALASQNSTDVPVTLTVNNLSQGGVGTYNDENNPVVIINGTAGQTARVVLTKGFIQPVSLDAFTNGTPEQQEFAPVLQSQLDDLAASDFPANNAVEFQTVDVVLTGEDQDISDLFDFSGVAAFDFDGEEQLPLGFVASAIDSNGNNEPIGSVTEPIYLQFSDSEDTILYRVNAGGSEVAALDGDIVWSADTVDNNSPFLSNPGSNNSASFPIVGPGANVPENIPDAIFNTERWDQPGGSEMEWAFDVPESGLYEVRLYMGNGFSGTNDPGERIFDVAIEGSVPANLDNLDLVSEFGNEVGGVISNTVTVTDGTLNIEFIHGVENPLINGIEIVQLGV